MSFWKKFADAVMIAAPIATQAFNLPPEVAGAIGTGVIVGQQMKGASNEDKAAKAAIVAAAGLSAANALRVQHGLPPLVDAMAAQDALAQSVRLTYDIAKMVQTAKGSTMPTP